MFDLMQEIDKINAHNKDAFMFSTSTGYIIDVFKTSPKEKNFGIYVKNKNGENVYYKVGIVKNIELFKKALFG